MFWRSYLPWCSYCADVATCFDIAICLGSYTADEATPREKPFSAKARHIRPWSLPILKAEPGYAVGRSQPDPGPVHLHLLIRLVSRSDITALTPASSALRSELSGPLIRQGLCLQGLWPRCRDGFMSQRPLGPKQSDSSLVQSGSSPLGPTALCPVFATRILCTGTFSHLSAQSLDAPRVSFVVLFLCHPRAGRLTMRFTSCPARMNSCI